jgi:hypothetical protein
MRKIYLPVLVACAALGILSCGNSVVTGLDAGLDDSCTVAADCAWGEITHEILSAADCPCLLGCPTLPESKTVVERRKAQYDALCTPGKDGKGALCPVDDCAYPPALACQAGHCVVGLDAGH